MSFQEQNGVFLPEGTSFASGEPVRVTIDNRTDLPDELVEEAIETHWVENAPILGMSGPTTFGTYANNTRGSLLARGKYSTPGNVFGEIELARSLAEEDDDCRATIGGLLATAFESRAQNLHEDPEVLQIFNRAARKNGLTRAFKRVYREYLIAGSVTMVTLPVRHTFEFKHDGVARAITRSLGVPYIGIIPAEHVRVLDYEDMFGTSPLAYKPPFGRIKDWLEAFFDKGTTVAQKAQMRREKPVWAALFVEQLTVDNSLETLFAGGQEVYRLNPQMAHRIKMPCDGPYPRPLLTANFALLEAKRLLNIMDYGLLQGGINFLVVAKKGNDQHKASGPEIESLTETVRKAARTGVIVGDHRLDIEIITPDLQVLLDVDKRELVGRKLAATLMRIPPRSVEGSGGEGEKATAEILARVITSDRNDLLEFFEESVYEPLVARYASIFGRGADSPRIWFPKIVLQGLAQFTDMVLKLRDRGDIPRRYGVEAAGFDYDAAVSQRQVELERGDDEVMQAAPVPFSSPQSGPQDNNSGRPPSSGGGGGQDSARPRRLIRRTRGETVRAFEEGAGIIRVGELTAAILDQFPDRRMDGTRIMEADRAAIDALEACQVGTQIIVPVNPSHVVTDHRVARLEDGISMILGQTRSGAIVAKAITFKDSTHTVDEAIERVGAWGYDIERAEED